MSSSSVHDPCYYFVIYFPVLLTGCSSICWWRGPFFALSPTLTDVAGFDGRLGTLSKEIKKPRTESDVRPVMLFATVFQITSFFSSNLTAQNISFVVSRGRESRLNEWEGWCSCESAVPVSLKTPVNRAFLDLYNYSLDIKATVSTWHETSNRMSDRVFRPREHVQIMNVTKSI